MISLLDSQRRIEDGIVLIDSDPPVVPRSIALPCNPNTLMGSLQAGVVDRKSDR